MWNEWNSLFCMFEDQNDTTEMYNLQTDPYQMHNLLDPGSSWHVNRLRELTSCKGFQGCNNDVVVKVVPKNSEDQELRLPRFDLDYWIEAIGGAFYNFTYKHFWSPALSITFGLNNISSRAYFHRCCIFAFDFYILSKRRQSAFWLSSI